MLIYVAGPLTTGDPFVNLNLAARAGNRLLRAGFLPIVPHLFSFSEIIDPVTPERGTSWERWMQFCLGYVLRCDAVLRLPGPSRGADEEVAFAKEHGIQVYYDEAELLRVRRPRSIKPAHDCAHERTYEVGLWPRCVNCGSWKELDGTFRNS